MVSHNSVSKRFGYAGGKYLKTKYFLDFFCTVLLFSYKIPKKRSVFSEQFSEQQLEKR
jgi:hypothetical protein